MPYLTGRTPAQERAIAMRMQAAFERSMQATVEREIRRAMREAADAIEAQGAPQMAQHEARMRRIYEATYQQVMPAAGSRILEAAGKSHGRTLRRKDARGEFEAAVQAFLQTQAAIRVVQVSDTTMEQIRAAVVAAERDGLGQDGIAARIRSNAPQIARVRSLVIARTEVHTAATAASDEAAKATGVVQGKEWAAAEDARTRPTHSGADGQRVGMNDRFQVGLASLAYPGEPGGPAAEVINCRCQTAYIT